MHRLRRSLIPLCLGFLLFSLPVAASEVVSANPSPFPVPAGLEPAVEFW
jgi:hypothetical protein